MNIEQIAQEVADELFLGGKAVGHEPAEFLHRCLNKLAEQDVEPVATVQCIDGVTIGYLEVAHPVGAKLYTEPQLLAAQQRAAEACAKAVERLIGGDGLCADDGVWIHDCAEAIRNGDWMEYL